MRGYEFYRIAVAHIADGLNSTDAAESAAGR
jgi:hypothetical protein